MTTAALRIHENDQMGCDNYPSDPFGFSAASDHWTAASAAAEISALTLAHTTARSFLIRKSRASGPRAVSAQGTRSIAKGRGGRQGGTPQDAGDDLGKLGHEDGEQEGGAEVDEEVQHGGHRLRHVAVHLHSTTAAESVACRGPRPAALQPDSYCRTGGGARTVAFASREAKGLGWSVGPSLYTTSSCHMKAD